MPKTFIKIRTWRCPDCDYAQDFEPTTELMAVHFRGVPAKVCPACFLGNNPTGIKVAVVLPKETRSEKKITMTVMGEEDIGPEIVRQDEERVKEGRPVRTELEKTAYRAKRKQDIVEAVARARTFEDV